MKRVSKRKILQSNVNTRQLAFSPQSDYSGRIDGGYFSQKWTQVPPTIAMCVRERKRDTSIIKVTFPASLLWLVNGGECMCMNCHKDRVTVCPVIMAGQRRTRSTGEGVKIALPGNRVTRDEKRERGKVKKEASLLW